jgi:hypothetical protein
MISASTRRKIVANCVLGIGLGFVVCGTCPHWDVWHAVVTILGFILVGVSTIVRHVGLW